MTTEQFKNIQESVPESAGVLANPSLTPEDRYRMIAEAAFFRAEARGFSGGDMDEDWRQAEAEIDRLLQSGSAQEPTVEEIEQRVSSVLEGDTASIAEQVRAITLQAISDGAQADEAKLKLVMAAIVKGAREGAARRVEHGTQALKEAIRGMDTALAETVEATQHVINEAAERTGEFSQAALKKAADRINAMEAQFVDTLGEAAQQAHGFGKATLQSLVKQARDSGSDVGLRARSVLSHLAHTLSDTTPEQLQKGEDAAHKEAGNL